MYGLGMYSAYGQYSVAGINAALLVAIATRLLVGVCWFFMFKRAGKKPYYAFIPFLGPYTAFYMVWEDFSLSAIFAATTFIGFVDAVGVEHQIITAFTVVNFIMWWIMALLTSVAFQTNLFVGFLYGGVPWLGGFIFATWPTFSYKGAWSTDPEADQNLTPKERKKRRRKAERAAKAAKKK